MNRIKTAKTQRLGYLEPEGQKIGLLGAFSLYRAEDTGTGHTYIEAYDMSRRCGIRYKRAAYIALHKDSDYPAAYCVSMVSVDNEYKGNGLSHKLYRWLLVNHPKLVLRAGPDQSPGGRYIWYNLAKYKDILIYAVNVETEQITDAISRSHKRRELALGSTVIYDNDEVEYDVFACAAR